MAGEGNRLDFYLEDNQPDYAPLDFWHETARYGNADPVLKLGMTKHPYAGQVMDLGMKPSPPTFGFRTEGLASYHGAEEESDTLTELVQSMNYDSPKDFFDRHQAEGNIREGLSYDEWVSQTKKLSNGDMAVMINAHSRNPMEPFAWSHEWGHLGQFEVSKKLPGREERQRMRDILYADSRNLNNLEENIKWLEKRDAKVGSNKWNAILKNTLIEDRLANEALEAIDKSPGAEPNLRIFSDWMSGGRTKEGYERVRAERRMYWEMKGYPNQIGVKEREMPGFWDSMMKKLGFKD